MIMEEDEAISRGEEEEGGEEDDDEDEDEGEDERGGCKEAKRETVCDLI